MWNSALGVWEEDLEEDDAIAGNLYILTSSHASKQCKTFHHLSLRSGPFWKSLFLFLDDKQVKCFPPHQTCRFRHLKGAAGGFPVSD